MKDGRPPDGLETSWQKCTSVTLNLVLRYNDRNPEPPFMNFGLIVSCFGCLLRAGVATNYGVSFTNRTAYKRTPEDESHDSRHRFCIAVLLSTTAV